PPQISWKEKRAKPPPAGSAPLAEARADDRSLGIELRDRDVAAGVVELRVDLVRQDDEVVLPRDVCDFFDIALAERGAGWIVRIVEDQQPGSGRMSATELIERRGGQPPAAPDARRQPQHIAAEEPRLRLVGDPARGGQQQIAVERELQKENQLFR